MTRRRRWPLALLVLLGLLVVVRLALPYVLEWQMNRAIARSPDFRGAVGDVDLALWRGAFQLEDVALVATADTVPLNRLDIARLDVQVDWAALLEGDLVTEIDVIEPQAVVTPGKAERTEEVEVPLAERFAEALPFRLDRMEVHRGRIDFEGRRGERALSLPIEDVRFEVRNLTNRERLEGSQFAAATFAGVVAGSGELQGKVRFDPLADTPLFDLDATLEGLRLTDLNDLLLAYAGIDVQGGTASLFVEAAAKEGRFSGYAKPVIEDLEVFSLEEKHENVGQFLKEALAGVAEEVLATKEKERLATRVRVQGRLDDPEVGTFDAVLQVLRNAFIQAILPRLDRSVDLGRLGQTLRKAPDPDGD